MLQITRREMIGACGAMAAGAALPEWIRAEGGRLEGAGRIPLVHLTDLYDPPQDPDDHIDLATVAALPEYELRGVVLDITKRFLLPKPEGWDIARQPGFASVQRLAQLTGRKIRVAMGPIQPLAHPGDQALDRPAAEQAGVDLLLDVLRQSDTPVTLSVVGSARVLAAAFNRAPDLLRAKTRTILLNAGATGGTKREWNVGLDVAAYVALWRSGLPIDWFPCATERSAFVAAHERGTFWKAPHAVLFRGLPEALQDWFRTAFRETTQPPGTERKQEERGGADWQRVLEGERNLCATASLIMGAGRVLARTPDGWRFVPGAVAQGFEIWPLRLDPIHAMVSDAGEMSWEAVSDAAKVRLFGRKPDAGYGAAMAEALNALLRSAAWTRQASD